MKYQISITDMTREELFAVSNMLASMGATPVSTDPTTADRLNRVVGEIAARSGATPSTPTPPPSAPPLAPVADPFTAPAAPIQPPAPVGEAPAFDSRGYPHNPQFHAESKRQNKDGSWALRKGVDKDGLTKWETTIATQPPAPTVPTPPPASAPAPTAAQLNAQFAPHLAPVADPFTAPPAPVAAPLAPPAPPAPPAPVTVKSVTYAQWHSMYMNLVTAGKMTPEKYSDIATRYGADENPMKFSDDDTARALCYAEFEALAA